MLFLKSVVLLPEDEARAAAVRCGVAQLAGDGDGVAEVDVLLSRAEDGGRGSVDQQVRGQGLHTRRGGGLQQPTITRSTKVSRLSRHNLGIKLGLKVKVMHLQFRVVSTG